MSIASLDTASQEAKILTHVKTKNPNQTKPKPVLYWHHSSFYVIGRQLKLATVEITEKQNGGLQLLLDNEGGGSP